MQIVERSRITVARKREILKKLDLCRQELPFASWSKEAIFDACDDYVKSTDGILTTSAFMKKGMPSHAVITLRFGMTAKEFRDKYYPLKLTPPVSPYHHHPVSFWNSRFVSEYNRIRPSSAVKYNKLRDKKFPSWVTVAKMNGLTTWRQLLDKLGLEPFSSGDPVCTFQIIPPTVPEEET